jgi:hypothetical protein
MHCYGAHSGDDEFCEICLEFRENCDIRAVQC